MLRIVLKIPAYGQHAPYEYHDASEVKTFDVDLPEVEAVLRRKPQKNESPAVLVGVELRAPAPAEGGAK